MLGKELPKKLALIHEGDTYEKVSLTLGGKEYKSEYIQEKKVCFWRLRILDAAAPYGEYEIYKAEFEKNELLYGLLLPRG